MKDQVALEVFHKVVGKLCEALVADLRAKLRDTPWKSGYVDVRWSADGEVRIDKLRVELVDGRTLADLDISDDVDLLLEEAWSVNDGRLSARWYGLLVTAYPDGKCQVRYNYDPE